MTVKEFIIEMYRQKLIKINEYYSEEEDSWELNIPDSLINEIIKPFKKCGCGLSHSQDIEKSLDGISWIVIACCICKTCWIPIPCTRYAYENPHEGHDWGHRHKITFDEHRDFQIANMFR